MPRSWTISPRSVAAVDQTVHSFGLVRARTLSRQSQLQLTTSLLAIACAFRMADQFQRASPVAGISSSRHHKSRRGRRPWGPNTLHVDARYHRSTLEFCILSGQAPLAFYKGISCIPPVLNTPKMPSFLRAYSELNSNPNPHYLHDPDDLIVQQNFGDHSLCTWVRKRKNDDVHKGLMKKRKKFHTQCKLDRDILNRTLTTSDHSVKE